MPPKLRTMTLPPRPLSSHAEKGAYGSSPKGANHVNGGAQQSAPRGSGPDAPIGREKGKGKERDWSMGDGAASASVYSFPSSFYPYGSMQPANMPHYDPYTPQYHSHSAPAPPPNFRPPPPNRPSPHSSMPLPFRHQPLPPMSFTAPPIRKRTPSPVSPNGTPLRRPKAAYTGPALIPSDKYLAQVNSKTCRPPASGEKKFLLVLDLNNTLLFRRQRTRNGSKHPVPRPFLSEFLSFIFLPSSPFYPLVYSSARRANVQSMLSTIGLGVDGRPVTVFAREDMGLSAKDFEGHGETVKDLESVWKVLNSKEDGKERWGAWNTVLLDDEAFKASLQPYNHLPIEPYFASPSELEICLSPPPRFRSRSLSPFETSDPIASSTSTDQHLLSTIYFLSQFTKEKNVARYIKLGGLKLLREKHGEEGLVSNGRELLLKSGVTIGDGGWRGGWWISKDINDKASEDEADEDEYELVVTKIEPTKS